MTNKKSQTDHGILEGRGYVRGPGYTRQIN